jgi:1-acyl-sn-glycerol-3-phosphate acyltransferase
LKEKGPLLLACNHPNSFLDSVLLDTIFKEPVWSLARGDVFKKPFYIKLLTALKILPVYRTSEGTENLSENYKTFDECIKIFKQNGVICIFSEGKCINEWHLRPLKKGTARLAVKAWDENIPLKVLPVGINFSSFNLFGKNIIMNFGEIISRDDIVLTDADGLKHQSFNNKLQEQLEKLVIEIPLHDMVKQESVFKIEKKWFQKILLTLPAAAGWLFHWPLFSPLKKFVKTKTKNTDHYDSVIMALLMLSYPIYLLLLTFIVWFVSGNGWSFSLFLILPFTAWSFVQLKKQTDH